MHITPSLPISTFSGLPVELLPLIVQRLDIACRQQLAQVSALYSKQLQLIDLTATQAHQLLHNENFLLFLGNRAGLFALIKEIEVFANDKKFKAILKNVQNCKNLKTLSFVGCPPAGLYPQLARFPSVTKVVLKFWSEKWQEMLWYDNQNVKIHIYEENASDELIQFACQRKRSHLKIFTYHKAADLSTEPFALKTLEQLIHFKAERGLHDECKILSKQAVQLGSAIEANRLGYRYMSGTGIETPNGEKAFKYIFKSAMQGYAAAQTNLASLYARGEGVAHNFKEAASWSQAAAEQGHSGAQLHLAMLYLYGNGVQQSGAQACQWLLRSARRGNIESQYTLGKMFLFSIHVEKNEKEAFYWTKKAAERGFALSQYDLALMYIKGYGTKPSTGNYLFWMRSAALQGTQAAQRLLALAYRDGIGVEKNPIQMERWLEAAAKQGDVFSQYDLAIIYGRGLDGIPKDMEKARRWFEEAEGQNDTEAKSYFKAICLEAKLPPLFE